VWADNWPYVLWVLTKYDKETDREILEIKQILQYYFKVRTFKNILPLTLNSKMTLQTAAFESGVYLCWCQFHKCLMRAFFEQYFISYHTYLDMSTLLNLLMGVRFQWFSLLPQLPLKNVSRFKSGQNRLKNYHFVKEFL